MKDAEQTQLMRMVRLTMRAAQKCVNAYSCPKSRRDFTQPQLVACLVLKVANRSDYRGVCELLTLSEPLREAIGLEKVPHWTTLQKFMAKPQVAEVIDAVMAQVLREVGVLERPGDIAVDSSGMQNGVASLHYVAKRGRNGRGQVRKTVKVSVAVLCGALLPVGLVVSLGSSADMQQMPALLDQVESRMTPTALYADSGYDAEWVHERCREEWGTESLIPPVVRAPDGRIKTKWRAAMLELPEVYGRRWHVESFFSGLKRTTMGTLASRQPNTLLAEAQMKVLTYAIRR